MPCRHNRSALTRASQLPGTSSFKVHSWRNLKHREPIPTSCGFLGQISPSRCEQPAATLTPPPCHVLARTYEASIPPVNSPAGGKQRTFFRKRFTPPPPNPDPPHRSSDRRLRVITEGRCFPSQPMRFEVWARGRS